jgi:KUP system potassium uptake protein
MITDTKPATGRYLARLTLGALGVVYGDIGTSPLYALRECFAGSRPLPPTPTNVLGILSLIFWSLLLIVSLKYLAIVLRATNRGEGGILALMALAFPKRSPGASRRRALLIGLGVFGAALLYGDGMITPAISVLSAVEGLKVATPAFEHYVIPATILTDEVRRWMPLNGWKSKSSPQGSNASSPTTASWRSLMCPNCWPTRP